MRLEANPNSTCWIFPARTSRSFRNGCGIYLILLSPQLNLRRRLRPCRLLASGLHVLVRCNNAISAVPSRSDSGLMVFTIMAPLPAESYALTQSSVIRSMEWLSTAIMPILSGQHRRQHRNRYRDLQPVAGLTVLMKPNNAISAVASRSAMGLMMLTITVALPTASHALTGSSAIRSLG